MLNDEHQLTLGEPVMTSPNNATPLRLAILGAGGLGKGMLKRARLTPDFNPVAIVDSQAYLFDEDGLDIDAILEAKQLNEVQNHIPSATAIESLFQLHGDKFDAVFVALPNLPVEFIPTIVEKAVRNSEFKGVFVDALKRTKAVELMMDKSERLQSEQVLYITGAGATPGFLSTVAAVAAQSFVQVTAVDIKFGVGIANWDAYKATIREDFIHLEGFTPERVAAMTDAEIEAELDKRNGVIELVNMEHADDIILELAGICPRDAVTVGGLVDTRNAKKPISTTVSITGLTTEGIEGTHVLTLSDVTTMVDNVCGPALGFVRQGWRQYKQRGLTGVVTSADLMPCGPAITSTLKQTTAV
jgi:hypothetical protein